MPFREIVNFTLLLLPIMFCELILFTQTPAVSLSIFLSFLISKSFTKIRLNSIKYVLFLFVGFHLFSYYSLITYGFDMIPSYLYGESRHLVGVNSLIEFRPSGLFLEPSTFSVSYSALTIMLLYNKDNDRFKKLYLILSVVFAILTFSVISIISIIILLVYFRTFINSYLYRIILTLSSSFFIFSFFTEFIIPKLSLYLENGIEKYSRVRLVFDALENFSLIPTNYVSQGIALDNGAIVFLFLLAGIFSLPLITYLMKKSFLDFKILLLILSKISITYPLIWLLIKQSNETQNSNRHK